MTRILRPTDYGQRTDNGPRTTDDGIQNDSPRRKSSSDPNESTGAFLLAFVDLALDPESFGPQAHLTEFEALFGAIKAAPCLPR